MTHEQPDLVGTTLGERYQVTREIGRGAMGTVYEARHPLIGRRFAIKILHRSCSTASQRERFLHEARAAGAISHPHIVQVQDFGVAPSGAPYLVMEYVDGVDLQEHLQQQGTLDVAEALEICEQLLSALEVIHAAGLVHRDMKPANVMLARSSRRRVFAKLLDFGIARAINPVWQRPDLTRVDQVLGTPAYLSPEQAGGGQADQRWDLWAVAIILYELLSGKLPFNLESFEQVRKDILNCRLVPIRNRRSDLPDWLVDVLTRAHHPRLEQRYPTATAFLQALETQNAHPEGAEGVDARTVPFVRIELQAPSPRLLRQLVGERSPQRPAEESQAAEATSPFSPCPTDRITLAEGEGCESSDGSPIRGSDARGGELPANELWQSSLSLTETRRRRGGIIASALALAILAGAVAAYLLLTRGV